MKNDHAELAEEYKQATKDRQVRAIQKAILALPKLQIFLNCFSALVGEDVDTPVKYVEDGDITLEWQWQLGSTVIWIKPDNTLEYAYWTYRTDAADEGEITSLKKLKEVYELWIQY